MMIKTELIRKILAISGLAFIFSANTVLAVNYPTLAPLPGTGITDGVKTVVGADNKPKTESCTVSANDPACTPVVVVGNTGVTSGSLGGYFNSLYRLAVAGASILAVLMIVIGGFTYLSTDAIGNKEEGRSQ